jgi:8-oxo-dGTP pyrophosphatase MutT (NUDIX family)
VTDFEARLAGYAPPAPEPPADPDQAAVAAVLRPGANGPEVLLMVRAERPGDRWSGQVSLPGGKAEPSDARLFETAVRETEEELGLDLGRRARPLCRLPGLQARARGGPVSLFITPFVFATEDPGPVRPGPEASEAFWLPLADAADGRIDHRYRLVRPEGELLLPAWRHERRVIWGLTHRMLSGLIDLLRAPDR